MQPLRLCLFLASIAVLKASETSEKVLDFISYVSGDYDNKEQRQQPGDNHNSVQFRNVPVDIPCLRPTMTAHALPFMNDVYRGICDKPKAHTRLSISFPCLRQLRSNLYPDPVLFVEQAANGVNVIFSVVVIKDGIEDTVALIIYNFTDYTKYKPGEYNVENLSNISCGDLQGGEDCIGSYRVSSEGFVFGNFPQCGLTVNGKHPRLTGMHKCDSTTMTLPMNPSYKSPVEPYEYLKRKKYPLINPPKDYVSPCGN